LGKKKASDHKHERDSDKKESTGHVVHPEDASEEEQIFSIGRQIDPRMLTWIEQDKKVRTRAMGRRVRTLSARRGTYVKSKIPGDTVKDIALDATIRAACQNRPAGTSQAFKVRIEKQDIREKLRIGKISTPTVFVVDASGSMFTSERMESAKGAVFSMLVNAYQKRDKVGLVAFREHRAEVILPLCSSLDYAIQCLKDLGSGGPTPLSAGLQKGLELLIREKRKNPEALPVLVLISDGRANVPMAAGSNIEDELIELTDLAWKNRLSMIFVDVERQETASTRHGNNKRVLQNRMSYYHVENLTADALAQIVSREKNVLNSLIG
jgi:magnesium chelatase subunit D